MASEREAQPADSSNRPPALQANPELGRDVESRAGAASIADGIDEDVSYATSGGAPGVDGITPRDYDGSVAERFAAIHDGTSNTVFTPRTPAMLDGKGNDVLTEEVALKSRADADVALGGPDTTERILPYVEQQNLHGYGTVSGLAGEVDVNIPNTNGIVTDNVDPDELGRGPSTLLPNIVDPAGSDEFKTLSGMSHEYGIADDGGDDGDVDLDVDL